MVPLTSQHYLSRPFQNSESVSLTQNSDRVPPHPPRSQTLTHTYKEPPTAASAHLPTIQSALLSHDASHWHNGEKIRFHPPQGLCSGADMENDFRELLRPIKLISGSLTNETHFFSLH